MDGKMEYLEMVSDVFFVDDDQIFYFCFYLLDFFF